MKKKDNNNFIIKAEITIFSKVFSYFHTHYNIKVEFDSDKNITDVSVSQNCRCGDIGDPWLEKEKVLNACIKMASRLIDLAFNIDKYECNTNYYLENALIKIRNYGRFSIIEIEDMESNDYLKKINGEKINSYVSNYKTHKVAYENEEAIFKNIFVNPLDFYDPITWEEIQIEMISSIPIPEPSFSDKLKEVFRKWQYTLAQIFTE